MKRALYTLIFLCALLAAAAIAGCGGDDDDGTSAQAGNEGQEEVIKMTGVFPYQLEGNHYNMGHDAAIRAAMETVGADRFDYDAVYGIPYNDRMTRTVQQLFQEGNDVVIDGLVSAELFTDACQQFEDRICLGYYSYSDPAHAGASNLQAYYVDMAPMWYAEGIAAGHLTETDTVGFVSSFKLPFNTAILNSYALGCQSVNPECEVRNVYVNSFFDPPGATEAANTLIDAGADVINHFMDDVSPVQAAQNRGVLGFGAYADSSNEVPDAWVTGVLFENAWEYSYTEMFQSIADGTFEPNQPVIYGTPEPPNMELAPFGEFVPEDVKEETVGAIEAVRNGENVLVGPIRDEDGEIRIPEGEEIDLRGPFIYGEWDWAVEGVIGF